jgi:prefoldin subunit 5
MTNTAQDKAEAIKREAQQLSKDIQALKEEATKLLTQLAQLKR